MTNKSINSICILNNTLNTGGAEKNCVVLCNELVKRGFDVELWITRLGNTPLLQLIDVRVKIRSIPGKRVRNSLFTLKDMMVNCKSKIFLIYNIELLVPAYFINRLYNLQLKIVGRSITTLSMDYNTHGLIGKKIWFKLISYTANKIDYMIAQSAGMKEDLMKSFNVSESKIKVIPNPAYSFSNDIPKPNVTKNKEILFVGRLTEAKGMKYLLEAFQIAKKSIPDLRLTIVGSGEILDDLKNLVEKAGLTGSITFEGYKSDLSNYYINASATVLTSLVEGFPNVLVESISFGTPVISFDCPSGPKDIIIPNVNGILVEHLNVMDFAQAIIDIINENISFDKNKVIESSKRYNLESIISQYEQILFN